MVAFSWSHRSNIENNIRTLYNRRRALANFTMTHEEYIQTFVPAEARDLFRNIAPYNGLTAYATTRLDLQQFGHPGEARITIRGDVKAAPPIVKGMALQPDAPQEIVEGIKTWLENGGDVSRDWGRVLFVFQRLNENYGKAAMRHYWPSIMALCDGNDATKEFVAELQSMKPPSSLKPLPAGLLPLIRKTASSISTAQLIPHDVTTKDFGDVTIMPATAQACEEDGFRFCGMS